MIVVAHGFPWSTHAIHFAIIMLLFNVINLGVSELFCFLWDVETCEHSLRGVLLTVTRNVDYSWGLVVGFVYAWFHLVDNHAKN